MATIGIVDFFTEDHAACNRLYAALEALADEEGPVPEAVFGQFERALDRHLAMEEGVLSRPWRRPLGSGAGPPR